MARGDRQRASASLPAGAGNGKVNAELAARQAARPRL